MAFSELQISLIGIGAAAVAGVWAYNKWQERQHRRAAERVFRGSQSDVLLDGETKPVEDVTPPSAPITATPAERIEPVLGATEVAEPDAAVENDVRPPAPSEHLLDEFVECAPHLETAEPIAGYALWEAQRPLAERLGRPLRWIGFDGENNWRSIGAHDAGRYRHLRVALQLADRQGPVSEELLTAFAQGIGELAGQLGAKLELPPLTEVMAHARALDTLCAGVDIQIALHVVHREGKALMGSKLRGLTEAAGLNWRDDGAFYRADSNGEALFTLVNLGAQPFTSGDGEALTTHGVTFWLDVPRVAAGASVFAQMLGVARQLVAGLDGVLVDDQRNPLSDGVLAGIRDKIAEIQRRMADHGIPAGGLRAQRLFW